MGDATASKAKQYPDIKFAIVDNAYDQAGFLAGGMSRSGFVCSVSSMQTPQSRTLRDQFPCGSRLASRPYNEDDE
jgi:hypothetical protein